MIHSPHPCRLAWKLRWEAQVLYIRIKPWVNIQHLGLLVIWKVTDSTPIVNFIFITQFVVSLKPTTLDCKWSVLKTLQKKNICNVWDKRKFMSSVRECIILQPMWTWEAQLGALALYLPDYNWKVEIWKWDIRSRNEIAWIGAL